MDERMFRDRRDAGVVLAEKLQEFRGLKNLLVLALPRGGIVVAYEVARSLRAPLDVFVTHKLGFPGQPELAMGAVSETGSVVLNSSLAAQVSKELLDREIETQREEILRRVRRYRGGKGVSGLEGKIVILVDDGLATGATARAAVEALKREKLEQLVVAVPVAPEDTAAEFEAMVDKFACLHRDPLFYAVGAYYDDFRQIDDEEVTDLLIRASEELKRESTLS